MNGWHALAAILTVMTVRGAPHRIAALHGLLGRSHTHTIERITRKSHGEYRDKHPSCKAHDNQTRDPRRGSQGRVRLETGGERSNTGRKSQVENEAQI